MARARDAESPLRQRWLAHFRSQLHGSAGASREAAALSGQARARIASGFGRRGVPIRRHIPILAAAGVDPRPRFFLCDIERQRTRPRSRRLHQLPGGRRAAPRSSPAWSKAFAARRPSWPRPRRRLPPSKPIILVKLGRSERGKAAASQPHRRDCRRRQVFDAVCRKYGVVRCPSLDDLIETCLAFMHGRLPKGPRIAMACYSRRRQGPDPRLRQRRRRRDGATDAGHSKTKLLGMIDPGLASENPLDVGPTVGVQAAKFSEICKVICADPTVDLMTVQGLLPTNPEDPFNPAPLQGCSHRPTSRSWPSAASRRTSPRPAASSKRNRRAVHSRPAGNGARAAGAGELCAGARTRCRGAAQAAASGAAAASRCRSLDPPARRNGLTPPRSELGEDRGTKRP